MCATGSPVRIEAPRPSRPPGRPPGSKDTHRRAYTPRGAAQGASHGPDVPVTVPFPNPGQVQPPPDGVGLGEDSCPKLFDRSRLTRGSRGVEPLTGSRTEKESSARRQNYDARASVRSWVRRPKVQYQEQQRVNGHDPLSHREDFEIAVEVPISTGLPLLDRAWDEH
jgi:hypothetical protein